MKKKLLMLLLVLIMPAMLLTGCGKIPQTENFTSEENTRFIYVKEYTYGDNDYFKILVDKETRVMYLYKRHRNGEASTAGLTALLNADGTPMLWEGKL
jgi:uncharacterized lipoprotein YehR (DUF1307 family)